MYSNIIKYSLSVEVRNHIMYCADSNILGGIAKKSERYFLCPNLRCKLSMPLVSFLLFSFFILSLCIKTDAFQKKEIRGSHNNNELSLEKIWVLKT